jgi:hypothetical protein
MAAPGERFAQASPQRRVAVAPRRADRQAKDNEFHSGPAQSTCRSRKRAAFEFVPAAMGAGVVQGFSTPPLMLLILLMTNNRGHYGGAGEQSTDQRVRLNHCRGDLLREPGPRGHLVHLS